MRRYRVVGSGVFLGLGIAWAVGCASAAPVAQTTAKATTQPAQPAPSPYPYLAPKDRPRKAKEALDKGTDEKTRYRAAWGLAISGYCRESAEALAIIAVDSARGNALRECAAMGLINFTHSMPVEIKRALQDKLYGALNAEKENLQGGVIQTLVAWGDADRIVRVLGEKLRDHPLEVIVLKKISSRKAAVTRLWEIYQTAPPVKGGSITLGRRWHAGDALILWRDKRGIDILLECLSVKEPKGSNSASFRRSLHHTFIRLAALFDDNFGYGRGGRWYPQLDKQLDKAIPKMAAWWKTNRQTWSFEVRFSNVLPKLEKGKALSKQQARVLSAKLANDAFAKRTFKHPSGKPVGKIKITPESFNEITQKDGRWVLRMVRSRGPEAFVDFALDGSDPKVVVNYSWR